MFDVAPSELLVLGAVALLVIPPKDIPKAMRVAGQWIGKFRSVTRQFRAGFDDMVREAELAEMEKKWAAENARIMREHPPASVMLPLADAPAANQLNEDDGAQGQLALAPRPMMTDGEVPLTDAKPS